MGQRRVNMIEMKPRQFYWTFWNLFIPLNAQTPSGPLQVYGPFFSSPFDSLSLWTGNDFTDDWAQAQIQSTDKETWEEYKVRPS